jgi:hypothetical protein
MPRVHLAIAITALIPLGSGAVIAADLEIVPRKAAREISVQQGPPNCSRWTDQCVNCTRTAEGDAPVCSNVGFACQPQAVRCLSQIPSKR